MERPLGDATIEDRKGRKTDTITCSVTAVAKRRHTVAIAENKGKRVSFSSELCVRRFSPLGSNDDYMIPLSPEAGILFSCSYISSVTESIIKGDVPERAPILECPASYALKLDDDDFTVFEEPWFFDTCQNDTDVEMDTEESQPTTQETPELVFGWTEEEVIARLECRLSNLDLATAEAWLSQLQQGDDKENANSNDNTAVQSCDLAVKDFLVKMLEHKCNEIVLRDEKRKQKNLLGCLLDVQLNYKRLAEEHKKQRLLSSGFLQRNLKSMAEKNWNWKSMWRQTVVRLLQEICLNCNVEVDNADDNKAQFTVRQRHGLLKLLATVSRKPKKIEELKILTDTSCLTPLHRSIFEYIFKKSRIEDYVGSIHSLRSFRGICSKASVIYGQIEYCAMQYNKLVDANLIRVNGDEFTLMVTVPPRRAFVTVRFVGLEANLYQMTSFATFDASEKQDSKALKQKRANVEKCILSHESFDLVELYFQIKAAL